MKISSVELRRIGLPLVSPFRTSFSSQTDRDVLLVKVIGDDSEGWGECVALKEPLYSYEYVEMAQHLMRTHLLQRLFAMGEVHAHQVAPALEAVKGHPMAKAAIEMAILDAELRASGTSFGQYLGSVRETVPAGVSVGIMDSIPQLVDSVGAYLDEGYVRIKLDRTGMGHRAGQDHPRAIWR